MKRQPIKTLITAGAISALIATSALASGFVNEKRAWLSLRPEVRVGYVQGLNDSLNFVFVDDTLVNALAKRGRTKCLIAQKTTAAILADRITTAYNEERYAPLAPSAIYIIRMGEVCRSYINEARLEYGLGPL